MNDLEIASQVQLKNINQIATKLGLSEDDIEMYGKYKAKLPLSKIDLEKVKRLTPAFEMEFVENSNEINFSSTDSKIYTSVDKAPLFPFYECEHITKRGKTNAAPANRCANKAFKSYLTQNISYPNEAYQQQIQGEVVISVIVEKDGSLTSPRRNRKTLNT